MTSRARAAARLEAWRRRLGARRTAPAARGSARSPRQNGARLPRARARSRLRVALAVSVVLAVLYLIGSCECTPRPLPPLEAPRPATQRPRPDAGPPRPRPRRPPRPSAAVSVAPVVRGELDLPRAAATPWLERLRLAVAARGPRLAECFQGADRPVALRWTASITPHEGVPSEHELASLDAGEALSEAQRRCLVEVLDRPRYELPTDAGATELPLRVSLVIEL